MPARRVPFLRRIIGEIDLVQARDDDQRLVGGVSSSSELLAIVSGLRAAVEERRRKNGDESSLAGRSLNFAFVSEPSLDSRGRVNKLDPREGRRIAAEEKRISRSSPSGSRRKNKRGAFFRVAGGIKANVDLAWDI